MEMVTNECEIKLKITSLKSKYEIAEMVEQVLLNSSLNNSEFALSIDEVKVTKQIKENEN